MSCINSSCRYKPNRRLKKKYAGDKDVEGEYTKELFAEIRHVSMFGTIVDFTCCVDGTVYNEWFQVGIDRSFSLIYIYLIFKLTRRKQKTVRFTKEQENKRLNKVEIRAKEDETSFEREKKENTREEEWEKLEGKETAE